MAGARVGALNDSASAAIETAWIVRVHDLRLPLPHDARPSTPREISTSLCRAPAAPGRVLRARVAIELALRVRYERFVVERPQTEDRQEDLVLSAAPGPCGVDVEGEHSSHSFANFRLT